MAVNSWPPTVARRSRFTRLPCAALLFATALAILMPSPAAADSRVGSETHIHLNVHLSNTTITEGESVTVSVRSPDSSLVYPHEMVMHDSAVATVTKTAATPTATGAGAVSFGSNTQLSWMSYLDNRANNNLGNGDFNSPSGTVTISTVDDSVITGHRTVTVSLSVNYNIGQYWYRTGGISPSIGAATLTILDNDLPQISLAFSNTVATDTIVEGTTTNVTASVASAATAAIPITIATAAGAGTTASDFTQTGTTLNIASGATTSTGVVTIASTDGTLEGDDKAVTVTASTTSNSYRGSSKTLTIRDKDQALTVSRVTGQVSESGGTFSFTVVLRIEPTADVTVTVTSNDPGEASVSPGTLTFTTGNWNSAQTVTVTGRDDNVDDGDQGYKIILNPASTGDAYYGNDSFVPSVPVSFSTTDDDTAGITTGTVTGQATEAGGTSSFTVKLDSEPTANVTITVTSGATDEGTASPGTLTFTSGNWNSTQTVTVTGANDHVDDGTQTYSITLASSSTDTNYGSDTVVADVTVSVTTTDDDTTGITFAHSGGSTQVTEAGGTDTFTVKLNSEPTANVTVAVSSEDTGEGTVSPGTLMFAPGNWNDNQTVTVTGVDDDIDDGTQTYNIVLNPASTDDSDYNTLPNVDVLAGTTDDDEARITFAHSGASTQVTEAGGTDTFTVKLNSEPTADVTVAVSSDDSGEGTASPNTLTFTSGNWNSTQTVTVTGQNDHIDDGTVSYNIVLNPSSPGMNGDSTYDGLDNVNVPAGTTDDSDAAGITFAHSGASTQVTEATGSGRTDTFTVRLNTEPTANVTVAVSSAATDEGAVNPTSLTFTSGNWNSTQTVTVTGVDDDIDDGDQTYNIVLNPSSPGVNGDSKYENLDSVNVPAGTTDNDAAGITTAHVGGGTTSVSETGTTDAFTVVLDSQPTANVTIAVGSEDTGEGSVNPNSLTFTSSNWNSTQTVTLTGVDDDVDDGDQTYDITLTPTSSDSNYNGSGNAVTVSAGTTDDSDAAGITTGSVTGQATEAGGTSSFTVKLDSEPTADVTITVTSGATDEGTASPNTLTFTSSNWNSTQTVTVTGVDDNIDDGTVTYNIVLNPASTGDTDYNGLSNVTVGVGTTDDSDAAGITFAHSGGATQVSETGTTDTFTVVLDSEPTANVTVTVTSGATDEGTVNPGTLTFTSSNWNSTQTITVTGQDDDIDDGTVSYNIVLAPSSTDGNYNALDNVNVPASTTDDSDAAGITTGSVTGQATEAGGTSSFTVKLDTEPTANVTIAVGSEDTGEGTASPGTLTFTSSNWNSTQTVTVTGVDDDIDDGTITYNIILDPDSTDTNYGSDTVVEDVTVSVSTTDDSDAAGITTGSVTGQATEAGGTSSFTVKLATEPTANVTIAVGSNDTGEGTPNPTSLTFTSSNWNSTQTVIVTGVDDDIDDGDQTYDITLTPSSSDSNYNGSGNAVTVSAGTTDNDEAGLTVAESGSSTTVTEAGVTDSFTVKLATQPSADVTVAVSSEDTGEGTVGPTTLTFTGGGTGNWNSTQTVTVTGQDDGLNDGTQTYNIVLNPASSGDNDYDSLDNVTVGVTTTDDDEPGIITGAVSGQATEAGGTSTFTVKLASQPTASVTVAVSSLDTGEGRPTPASLTYTSGNWNSTQTVTVTGQNDDLDDGDQRYNITLDPSSTDSDYGTLATDTVSVTTTDDDTAGLTLSEARLTIAEGGSDSYTVVLDSEPTADVTVAIGKGNADVSLGATSLTFTSGNWNSTQTVTVTIAADDDDYADSDTVTHTVTSADSDYNGRTDSVAVAVTGDGTIGVAMLASQSQIVVINDQDVTVVEGCAEVSQEIEVRLPPTLNQATRITCTPSPDVPLESKLFVLIDAEGVGTVVGIDVDPVPPGGVEICLPMSGDLINEAMAVGRSLTLAHYDTGTDEWEEVSGASYDAVTGLACASGITDFSPFGIAYPNMCPVFQGTIADQVYVLNTPIAALTLPMASGGDAPLNGPTLTPQTLAPGLSFNTATRTLSGIPTEERGAVTYTWAVTDADGDPAELQFTITVTNSREDERTRLRDLNESIIPELARALADGVGTAIGRRLETVIGGGEHMMTSLQQIAQSNLQALEDGTFKWRNALNGQHFATPLNHHVPLNLNNNQTRDVTAPSTTLWATGDWHDLDMDNDDIDWDGDAFAYHLGIDKDLGGGKIAGLMASWFESDIDYNQRDDNDEITGTHESEMLSIHPYFGWASADGDRLWLTLGYGEGEIEIDDEVEGLQKSDSILKTVSAGTAKRLYEQGDWTLDLKGEGQYTQWRVKDNGDRIDGLTIDAYRLRASLQGTHNQGLTSGNRLISMLELGLRYDGGDGETGNGVELGGRLDYQGGRVGIGTHGRILVAHEGDLDEWGVGGAIQINPDRHGRGLSLTLTPTWGTTTGGIQRLWTEGMALRKEDEQDTYTGLRLESEISYGLPHGGGLLTPYIGMNLLEDKHHYRMGGRFNLRDTMTLNLEAERLEQDDTDPENGIGIRFELQW